MLVSFDELILHCISINSRNQIAEAIRCYNVGAHRAAIVTAYITVCFDLIEKLKSLAASSDLEAKARVVELANLQEQQVKSDPDAITGLLKFERNLPHLFKEKFEFFGEVEFEAITRLVSDRNRCAHPIFRQDEEAYTPSAEIARVHIRNALDLVLTQEPKQGKAALKTLRSIITSSYFPDNKEEIVNRLEASPLKNARDSLITAFIDDATFGVATPGNSYFDEPAAVKSVEAVVLMRPAIAVPRVTRNINKLLQEADEDAVKFGSIMALRSPDIADNLSAASKPALKAYVKSPLGMSKSMAMDRALYIGWLEEFALAEIEKLGPKELKRSRGVPHPNIVDRAIAILSSVKSFDAANKASSDLLSLVKHFTEQQIRSLFLAAQSGEADLQGAFGFEAILGVLAKDNPIGLDALKKLLSEYKLNEPDWDNLISL